jgi:Uma2 family endonuclease
LEPNNKVQVFGLSPGGYIRYDENGITMSNLNGFQVWYDNNCQPKHEINTFMTTKNAIDFKESGSYKMNESLKYEDEIFENGVVDMGSLNHSFTIGRIAGLLFNDERFTVMPELTLDASQIDLSQFSVKAKKDLKPDISIYPNTVKRQRRDVIRMPQMPLLAIEVVSPEQGVEEILAKIDAYFALGIRSCWLVEPAVDVVHVFPQPEQHRTFDMHDTDIIDEIMDIHLPIGQIF